MHKFLSLSLTSSAALLVMACSGGNDSPSTTAPAPTSAPNTTPVAQTAEIDPLARGAKLYKRCQSCHSLDQEGRDKVGPNLWAIYGRTAGTKEGFKYSAAMAESGIVWDDASMDGYIENPRKYLPGGKMAFAGLRKAEDRAALWAYIKAETTPKE